MTSQKQLKAKIRARMAKTGERYVVARRHVAGSGSGSSRNGNGPVGAVVDHGWTLRGGTEPDAAALTNLLANRGVVGPDGPIPESVVLLAANGLGAGYILWEFAHDDSRHVVLGFAHRWQYKDDRLIAAADRLGVEVEWNRTGGAKAAAARLRAELAAGNAVVVWPDRFHIGYWHLPYFDGHGGHPVIAYADEGDRIHLDDRTLSPLTVSGDDLDRARSRVGSYQHAMLALRSSDQQIDGEVLRAAVQGGLRTTAEHLDGASTSFALPAFAKWSRLLVDERNAKAWPKVFADRRALLGALLSVWEGVSPAGMTGGNLRQLFADGLEQAADLLDTPALATEAERWRDIAGQWFDLGEVAAPADVPEVARARELTAVVSGAVAEGDEGEADRDAASAELWDLRAKYAAAPPWEPERDRVIMTELSEQLTEIVAAEAAAIARLRAAVGPG
jgi:hypothetical protein